MSSMYRFDRITRHHGFAPAIRHFSEKVSKGKWEGVVGLEVHAQLQTDSKLFSGAGTSYIERVNNQVALFDAAIPGTLPVLNKECVNKGILTALALNCTIHPVSWFDRKHYFYADLPAGYQITQQRAPFATDGFLDFDVVTPINLNNSYSKRSKIKQIQLEQDSGKSLHDAIGNLSLVDLNRAGIPLIEIVFEPDLRDGEEAACLVKELMLILRKLDTCSCKIEEGALRVDANISVRMEGDKTLGVRSEVKNIGGVRNVCNAVDFEIRRQTKLRMAGKPVINETRSWDADNNYTVSMRDKEIEQDYRFMPEPNLPPLRVSLEDDGSCVINVPSLKKRIPELPSNTRQNLATKYGLPNLTVIRLTYEPLLLELFIAIMEDNTDRNPKNVSNFLMMELLHALNRMKISTDDCKVTSAALGQLIDLLYGGIINRKIAVLILNELVQGCDETPLEIVEKNQWFQINDVAILEESCKLVIEYNPELVNIYLRAKKKNRPPLFQSIFQEVLKNTDQRANFLLTKEILERMLSDFEKSRNE